MLSFRPNKDAARLCLYHFLIHHCDPDTPLTPQLFENFCRLALMYDHWQKNSLALSQELQFILQHYNETYMLDWSLKDFVFPDHWQVVAIKNSIEGIYIFEKWAQKNYPTGTPVKVLYTREKDYLIIAQGGADDITVIHSSPLMLIQKGELQPLTTAIRLQYNGQLELKPNAPQYLKVDLNTYARLHMTQKNVKGMVIRGYIFQNQQAVDGKINQYPLLYYPLKKMEQYYIDRKTDPDYQELVQVLEKANELFNLRHPEALEFGRAACERGEAALENIFNNDNVVQVLVDQLKSQLYKS